MQEAEDPALASTRPSTSQRVWDAITTSMKDALQRGRSGLLGNNTASDEDADDIVANTFLSEVTDLQMQAIGMGFLSHREGKQFQSIFIYLLNDMICHQYGWSFSVTSLGLSKMQPVIVETIFEHYVFASCNQLYCHTPTTVMMCLQFLVCNLRRKQAAEG